MKIRANGIDIEIEDSAGGQASDQPVVLLIMGLGMQLVAPAIIARGGGRIQIDVEASMRDRERE